MVKELKNAEEELRKNAKANSGRRQVLSVEDKLLLTLEYYREYRSYDCIAASYGIGKGTVSRTINWVETVLVKSGLFKLPGKKELLKKHLGNRGNSSGFNRNTHRTPEEQAKEVLFGQKKRHTLKTQVVINRKTEEIICIAVYNGKAHDRTMFRETLNINPNITVLADSGYRGIHKDHSKSLYPLRHKEDKARMSDEERHRYNKAICSPRMKIEHVIGRIKHFKIDSERCRNRRKKFALRFGLICGIVNFQNPIRFPNAS